MKSCSDFLLVMSSEVETSLAVRFNIQRFLDSARNDR
jgi:hypothetical protein